MDIKTLEYMEERVVKARVIVNTIEQLRKNIEGVKNTKHIHFIHEGGYFLFDTKFGGLTETMKVSYELAAKEEIKMLEQELAEL